MPMHLNLNNMYHGSGPGIKINHNYIKRGKNYFHLAAGKVH
jgi:hypothetical protein